ncbi:regulatory protein, luxR family [Paraburkholderia sp. BL25I1N1]|nr:regulatory protein, luxR family [Paraburkholderia sp. BL25I1N1]
MSRFISGDPVAMVSWPNRKPQLIAEIQSIAQTIQCLTDPSRDRSRADDSTRNMARQLGVSPAAAKIHRRNLYRKLSISSQATPFLLIMGEDLEAG